MHIFNIRIFHVERMRYFYLKTETIRMVGVGFVSKSIGTLTFNNVSHISLHISDLLTLHDTQFSCLFAVATSICEYILQRHKE